MTEVSKRFEHFLKTNISRYPLIPSKSKEGIHVGDVLIQSQNNIKNIIKHKQTIYKEVSLNKAAIKIAEILALEGKTLRSDKIYKADQEYGKWFIDSQFMRSFYEKAVKKSDDVKADIYWARYQRSKELAQQYKNEVDRLVID